VSLPHSEPNKKVRSRPRAFELVINMHTAQQMGLTVPPLVLFQADRVIQ
jgi:hypothetical protein